MAGVLSSGVEVSSIGARPLVRVYYSAPDCVSSCRTRASSAWRRSSGTSIRATHLSRQSLRAGSAPCGSRTCSTGSAESAAGTSSPPAGSRRPRSSVRGLPSVRARAKGADEAAARGAPPGLGRGDRADRAIPRPGKGQAPRRAGVAGSTRRRHAGLLLGAPARASLPAATDRRRGARARRARRARAGAGRCSSRSRPEPGSPRHRPVPARAAGRLAHGRRVGDDLAAGVVARPRVRTARPAERREDPLGDLSPAVAASSRPGVHARRRRTACAGRPRHARGVDRGEPVRGERQLGEPDGSRRSHPHAYLALPRARRKRGVARPRLPAPAAARRLPARRLRRPEPRALRREREPPGRGRSRDRLRRPLLRQRSHSRSLGEYRLVAAGVRAGPAGDARRRRLRDVDGLPPTRDRAVPPACAPAAQTRSTSAEAVSQSARGDGPIRRRVHAPGRYVPRLG